MAAPSFPTNHAFRSHTQEKSFPLEKDRKFSWAVTWQTEIADQ